MNLRFLFFILFLFSTLAWSASNPGRWRFEFNYGTTTIDFSETQNSGIFTPKNVMQKSEVVDFMFQYFLVPPYIDLSFGVQSAGMNVKTPTDEASQFHWLSGYMNAGWLLPSFNDFWSIRLVFEGYYTTMIVKDDAFGFQDLWGGQIYPEVEYLPFGSDLFLQISPFLKIPMYTQSEQRKETTLGLKIKIPLGGSGGMKFPAYAYQKSIILKAYYSKIEMKFEKEGFIPSFMDVDHVGLTLGFNW